MRRLCAIVLWGLVLCGISAGATPPGGAWSNIAEYHVQASDASIIGIAAGPDGAMWFTESDRPGIGRISTSGVITEYRLGAGFTPYGIAA